MWVFVNKPRKCVAVAFWGTEQVKWKDFLTDMRVDPTTFNTERVQGTRAPQLDIIGIVRPAFPELLMLWLAQASLCESFPLPTYSGCAVAAC